MPRLWWALTQDELPRPRWRALQRYKILYTFFGVGEAAGDALNSSHCTGNMYQIIHARVFSMYSWINILDLNQPFNSRTKIWEAFKMKLI